jgi:hypothetical protein
MTPWARSATPGYRYGGNRFDLARFDEAWFARLKGLLDEASKRGIVVELTLFCATYGDRQWSASPFHPDNNVNSTGLADWRRLHTLSNGAILEIQEKLVRRLAEFLNGYDNLIYEIQNEPWSDRTLPVLVMNPYLQEPARNRWPNTADLADDESLAWQARVAAWIESAEKPLPNRHLVAQNLTNFRYPARAPVAGAGSFNFHYAYPEAAIWNRGLGIPIGYDETGFLGRDEALYRSQAWRFMLAGGSLFNHLDYSFSVGREDGTDVQPKSPGGGSPALRRQFLTLSRQLDSVPFLRMRHDPSVVEQAAGAVVQALSAPGEAYLIYLEGRGPVDLVLEIPAGAYRAEWIYPENGTSVPLSPVTHKGGALRLRTPDFAPDLALKITRQRS